MWIISDVEYNLTSIFSHFLYNTTGADRDMKYVWSIFHVHRKTMIFSVQHLRIISHFVMFQHTSYVIHVNWFCMGVKFGVSRRIESCIHREDILSFIHMRIDVCLTMQTKSIVVGVNGSMCLVTKMCYRAVGDWLRYTIEQIYRWYPAKGPYPPCLRMADRALLARYPRYAER